MKPLVSMLLAATLPLSLLGESTGSRDVSAAPHPSFIAVVDEPALPRVLLIGDSISMGYTLPVRSLLRSQANVHRPPQNCGDTGRGLQHLAAWLGDGRWDVIHFNFGLHDLKYLDDAGCYVPPEQGRQVTSLARYAENLGVLVTRLKKTGATLIFATTTPVPLGTPGRVAHDELRYNLAAVAVMDELGVAVNDLHAFVAARQAELQLPANVHFTEPGYEALAEIVAARIRAALQERTRSSQP